LSKPPIDREFAFDPTDTSKSKDFELMERIRNERPVCRPAEDVVLTTRYGDTRSAFLAAKQFSSVGDMRLPGIVVPLEESFLGEIDAPLHPKIRRILLRGFTRSAAAASEPWARELVRRRLEAFASAGGGDLMQGLAIPLPGSVSAHVLGIPDDLHAAVMGWCDELLHSSWPATGRTERGEGIAGSFPELSETLDRLIRERLDAGENAPDDLLSVMALSEDADGWKIGAHHVRTLCVNILAGSLSASYMIGNLLYRLLSDSGFDAELRSDRSRISDAVEESLRLESPVTFLFRTAREEGEIGGCPVHAGEHVMLGIGAANRDSSQWRNANDFQLGRENVAEHLAFGVGPHVCLGNHITRMIGRVVLEETLERFAPGELRLAPGFHWECVDHLQEYGPETLDAVVAAGD
jgi:cytochrome P450